MFKKTISLLLAAIMAFAIAACGEVPSQAESNQTTDNTSVEEQTDTANTENTSESTDTSSAIGNVANTLAEDEDTLIATYANKFEQKTYADSESGLSITYNIYLPEGYDESASFPMVVFIGDSSCAGSDATVSLTQGRGGLVWATEEWQSVYPTVVAVPTYPETILDDHGSYTTTEYVELTKRYIDYMCSEYSVDTDRIYGTGQSMGCMTTLILASEYPDLYAACLFVDGQWDISTLTGLGNQTFVYFAAEDDTNAWNGAQEVMSMFDTIPFLTNMRSGTATGLSMSCQRLQRNCSPLMKINISFHGQQEPSSLRAAAWAVPVHRTADSAVPAVLINQVKNRPVVSEAQVAVVTHPA